MLFRAFYLGLVSQGDARRGQAYCSSSIRESYAVNGYRERAAGTSVLCGDNGMCCPALEPVLPLWFSWRRASLGSLPTLCVLCSPPAQRHFPLHCHSQQHHSFGFWGNSLPFTNVSAATLWREGERLYGASPLTRWVGAVLLCHTAVQHWQARLCSAATSWATKAALLVPAMLGSHAAGRMFWGPILPEFTGGWW